MTVAGLSLRSGTDDSTTIDVRSLEGMMGERFVVWVEFGVETSPASKGAPLPAQASSDLAYAATVARDEGIPLVVVVSSTGAAIAAGLDPLEGWGRVAKALTDCSGEVPTILVVDGPAVAGPALLLGLADLVVMTAASYAFVNGPVMVSEFTGVEISTVELGGPVHLARHTGVPSLVVEDREAAVATVSELLAYLPSSADLEPDRWGCTDPVDRRCPEIGALDPTDCDR